MNGTLNVSTSKLKSTSSSFQSTGNQIKALTTQMTNLVNQLSGQVWSGDAATKYKNQFNGLQDDINRIIKMINEHVKDLNDMATAYEKAESENVTAASALASDVIV
jgi:WXG100 family type VII secretion target